MYLLTTPHRLPRQITEVKDFEDIRTRLLEHFRCHPDDSLYERTFEANDDELLELWGHDTRGPAEVMMCHECVGGTPAVQRTGSGDFLCERHFGEFNRADPCDGEEDDGERKMKTYSELFDELGGATHDRSVADKLAAHAANLGIENLALELARAINMGSFCGTNKKSAHLIQCLAMAIRRVSRGF